MYPALQTVNGGEENANLNEQMNGEDEMSAQKKYKMQLQADIMRLKEKYQNIGTMKLSQPTVSKTEQTPK